AHTPAGFPPGRIAASIQRPRRRRTTTPPAENSRAMRRLVTHVCRSLAVETKSPVQCSGTHGVGVPIGVTKSRGREALHGSAAAWRSPDRRGPRGGGLCELH